MSRTTLVVLVVLAVAAVVVITVVASRPDPLRIPEAPPVEPAGKGAPRFPPLPGPGPGETGPGPIDPGGDEDARGEGVGGTEEPAGRVHGVVLDERGEPVAGARVTLVEPTLDIEVEQGVFIADPRFRQVGVTDGAGRFEATAPLKREFSILTGAPGFVQDVPVTAIAGGPAVEVRLRRVKSILGTVVDDATGEAVERAALLLRKLTPTGETAPGPAMGYQAEGGSFVLSDLAAARYLLTVTVAGYDAWESDALSVSRENPHARIEARVSRTGVWGAVVLSLEGPDGTPVNRVNRVIVHQPDTGFLALSPLGAATPVRLEAPEGRHVLQVQVDGYLAEIRVVEVPGGGDAEVSITLREAGHVHVVVTDGEGNPTAGYRLSIFDAEGEELEYDLRIAEPSTSPGREPEEPLQGTQGMNQEIPGGDVTLKNLSPGRYRLHATREGASPAEQTFDVEAQGTVEVKLTLR